MSASLLEALRARMNAQEAQENDELYLACLTDAQSVLLGYTGRSAWPEGLNSAAVRLAAVFLNRLGTEGESARQEGDVHLSWADIPSEIKAAAAPYRLAVTGGEFHAV